MTTPPTALPSTPLTSHLALAPGWHLYRGPDGLWRLSTPEGAFVRLRGDEQVLAAAAAGRRVPGDGELVEALRSRGALAGVPAPAPVPVVVHVEGEDPVALAAAVLLRAAGSTVVTGPVDEGAVAACDALLCTSGHLPDAHWQAVDRWCRAAGTVWTAGGPESGSWVLGPAGRPGSTASWGDARARRLAAAPLPAELAALWAHLDEDAPATPWPSPTACAVLAGLLVHDLLDAVVDRARGRQLVVDPVALTATSHLVLALPRGLRGVAA